MTNAERQPQLGGGRGVRYMISFILLVKADAVQKMFSKTGKKRFSKSGHLEYYFLDYKHSTGKSKVKTVVSNVLSVYVYFIQITAMVPYHCPVSCLLLSFPEDTVPMTLSLPRGREDRKTLPPHHRVALLTGIPTLPLTTVKYSRLAFFAQLSTVSLTLIQRSLRVWGGIAHL